ncbi:MAG: hypothetical protein IID44_31035 [Planctomycetes bacterium]|nr:hypothetical protein [Planctomycetota bacterium]
MPSDSLNLSDRRIRDLFRSIGDGLRKRRARVRQQTLRAQPMSLLEWGRTFLPNHFAKPASGMHRWLEQRLGELEDRRGEKINVIGPRGAAKSTVVTLAYALRMAVEGREPYIWIISDTKHQACAHLENVKTELIENDALARTYPAATGKGPKWSGNTVVLRNRVTIEAFGTGQRIRGRRRGAHRPTLIICDDLQNDSHIESARSRELARRWFHGMLMKAGTKRTNVINLATALHRDALALELNRTPGWTSHVFQAIEAWPDNMSLWQSWEAIYCDAENPSRRHDARAFYDENRSAMNDGAVLLWPAEEDLYTLMQMRVEGGRAAFEREKQGSPINPEMCEWPEEYFDEQIWFETWPRQLRARVIALDPSKGRDAGRGDYSAYVIAGIDPRGVLYIEADLARRPTPQMVADGVELYRRVQPDAFGVEANQYQELLAAEFEREFERCGLLAARPWTINNHVNKLVRIRRLGPYLSSRRIRFKSDSPGTRLLVDQLQSFPAGDHDDGPDAAEMALRLLQVVLEDSGHDDGLGNQLVSVP